MTDILIHNVCFGKKTVTVEKAMEYSKNVTKDSTRAKGDIKYDSTTDAEENIEYEVTQKFDNASAVNVNTPTEDLGRKVEVEKSMDLTSHKDKVNLSNVKETKVEKQGGEGQEDKDPEFAIQRTKMKANEMNGDDDKINIEKCSKNSLESEDIEKVKKLKETEYEKHTSLEDKETVNAQELKPHSERFVVEQMRGEMCKQEMNEYYNTNPLDNKERKFENMEDIIPVVFSCETKSGGSDTKHERKTEKLRRGKYHPQKCSVNRSSDNSEEEICFSEDSDLEMDYKELDQDKYLLKSVPDKGATADGKELLKFAEVLYKCTLCTSIPSILTSEESFIRHVNKQHLSKDAHCHTCKLCFLKFRTEEDLKEHIIYSHTGSDENMSCDLTGSDITVSHDHMIDSNNDSDSDSSGHRQLRTKVVKRSKPVQDFESPKQLVDHTGIETLNGSLDLTQKTIDEKKDADKYLKCRSSKEGSEINIKQITDQIIKSDVQGRNVSNGNATKLSFIPSFTAEFGKYTKLVREGGNIVYFCQICNWKSPIKTTFQVHCNMSSHKSKVFSAENPEDNCDPNSKSPKHSEKSISPNMKNENPRDRQVGKRPYSAQDISVGPRMPDQNLFYNYIMRPRAVTQCRSRTPVVSPYGTSSFIEDARFTYKRPNEHPVDLALKKRKRFVKHPKLGQNSDSDSDDGRDGKSCPSVKSSHSSNMTLLRQKLLEGTCGNKQNCHITLRKDLKAFCELSNFPGDLSVGSNAKRFERCSKTLQLTDVKKEKFEYVGIDGVDLNKRWNYMAKMRNGSSSPVEKELVYKFRASDESKVEDALFAGYKCHACSFRYSEVEEYERHFDKVHKSTVGTLLNIQRETFGAHGSLWSHGQGDAGPGSRHLMDSSISSEVRGDPMAGKIGEPAVSGSCEMGENWRVQKLKEILPDYVIECDRGNTSRDYLLQCISSSSGIQDAVLWSSACNRAMRELFPNSQAQRKGKYKKTYYFGISMLDTNQIPEELPGTEGESQLYQPHRDINIDMEKIVEHLPSILNWTGNMECGVHRQDLLVLLTEAIHDSDVSNWGAQCNRAIRLVFPNIDMKRKGKYKTTMYLGVEFHKDVLKRLSSYSNSFVDAQSTDLSRKSPSNKSADNIVPTDQKRGRTLERLLKTGSNSPESVSQYEGSSVENSASVLSYPQWMKKEAQDEMGQYLAKFGGVTMFETQNGSVAEVAVLDDDTHDSVAPVDQGDRETAGNVTVDQGDDNDGDDEGESLDSVQTQ